MGIHESMRAAFKAQMKQGKYEGIMDKDNTFAAHEVVVDYILDNGPITSSDFCGLYGWTPDELDAVIAFSNSSDTPLSKASDGLINIKSRVEAKESRSKKLEFQPQGWHCDKCGEKLDPDDYEENGSWDYTCSSCDFTYVHGLTDLSNIPDDDETAVFMPRAPESRRKKTEASDPETVAQAIEEAIELVRDATDKAEKAAVEYPVLDYLRGAKQNLYQALQVLQN